MLYYTAASVDSDYSGVLGGTGNSISGNTLGGINDIVGGTDNKITGGASIGVVVGGSSNEIANTGIYEGIFAGLNNTISTTGQKNTIIGGEDNIIQNSGSRNGIYGGYGNSLNVATNQCHIFGGIQNYMTNNPYQCAIVAGQANGITGGNEKSVIIGGFNNEIKSYGDISTIIGSQTCSALGYKTTIIGAEQSHIYNDSRFSGIYGGYGNQLNGNNSQGIAIINSWQSKTEGSGSERHIIINSDSCSITGNSYTNKHATIIASANSEIEPGYERSVLIGLSGKSALYSATTHMENTYVWGHETHENTITTTISNQQTFNADLGMVQYCDVAAGNLNLIFQNVRNGEMYRWVIDNTSGGSISLNSISVPSGFTAVQDTGGGSVSAGTHTFYITCINDLVVVGHYR